MSEKRHTTIVLVGTLDTKGLEIGYMQRRMEAKGYETIVIDAGVLGTPQVEADIGREEVAQIGGESLEALKLKAQKTSDRMQIIQVMIEGVKKTVRRLHGEGELNGIISVGGSMGMAIGVSAMKALPVGVPKLMVGTHFYAQYLGEADLTIMRSPSDIMGLNPVTNLTLSQAADAICAMAAVQGPKEKTRPLVAMTALGVTTPAVILVKSLLEEKGYDTVIFHGSSEVMDELMERGVIDGIVDFSPNELIRIFTIKETPWRESRLEPAGKIGLPQVFVPGSLDMIVFRMAKDEIPDSYKHRKIYMHGPYITGVRTSREELQGLAKIIADKLNRARGPVAVVFPLKGFSAIDKEGFAFHEPETDRVLLEALTAELSERIEVVEVDAHILDDHFSRTVTNVYDKIAQKGVTLHE